MLQVSYQDSSSWFEEPACVIWSPTTSDFEPLVAAVKDLLGEGVAEIRLSSMPTWDPSSQYDLRMLLSEHDMAVTVDHCQQIMTLALSDATWHEFALLVESFLSAPDARSALCESRLDYLPYGHAECPIDVFLSNHFSV